MPAPASTSLAVGPGYRWSAYNDDNGVECAALYLDRGNLRGLVRHDSRGWYVAGTGTRQPIPDELIDTLRGTYPDGFPLLAEQAALSEPPAQLAEADPNAVVLAAVTAEYGITGPEAWKLAADVAARIRSEQANGLARRIVRDQQLANESDLDTLTAVSVADMLEQERPPRTPLFGQLLAEGHNATIVARWKVGKSTFVDNAAITAATAGMFLGHFETPEPTRVVLFNYELHDDDMADRLAAYNMPTSARHNIVVVNLRGRRLPLTTPKGRDIATRLLADHGAQLWIVDPFGAAFAAAGGQEENSNAEVRRFLIALDEIKRHANCPTLIMPVHTGRRNDAEGDEQGRGATVLEDWPDVRMLLTRDKTDHRYLRTEGRAWELTESRLTYNEQTRRLTLPGTDVGISRRKAKTRDHADTVTKIVHESPGSNVGQINDALTDAGITNNSDKSDAITTARTSGLIHFHTINRSKLHYPGPVHEDHNPCPGLTQNQ